MAMQVRRIVRATPPDMSSLETAVAPLLAVANAGSYHVRYENGAVVIEQGTFTGVNLAALDAAVAAAPARTDALDFQAQVDAMSVVEKAIVLTILDGINAVRAKLVPPLAAITIPQMLQAVKDKAASL